MKCKNACLTLLIGFSALAADEAWARREAGNGLQGNGGSGEQYQEQHQELRQERKAFQQDYRDQTQERARNRGVGPEGTRPSELEGGRGSLMTPDERENYQNQHRELRENRKGLRGTGHGAGRGGRGKGRAGANSGG
ncbi:hypothetical protein ACWJKU_17585 [Methylocaldum sp. MU1018]